MEELVPVALGFVLGFAIWRGTHRPVKMGSSSDFGACIGVRRNRSEWGISGELALSACRSRTCCGGRVRRWDPVALPAAAPATTRRRPAPGKLLIPGPSEIASQVFRIAHGAGPRRSLGPSTLVPEASDRT